MTEASFDPLALFSDRLAALVEGAARSVVAVHAGRRSMISGIHWRPGILVTAEEALERDEEIALTLPDGRRAAATLAGRDPSTDVAILRFSPDGLPVADSASAATLRPGHIVLAIGRHEDGVIASQGIAGFVGGPWQSMRGGKIDHFLRLDLALSRNAEGGALVDVSGRVLGMAVLGRGGRALAIPSSTVDRAVDQLLAKGHVARGYLGARLQPVRHGRAAREGERGVLVVSVDPDGPAARAGLLVGDIIIAWNGAPTSRVREIMRSLGTDSVGTTAELTLLRGGKEQKLSVALGERALS
jgi:S1-C subfamily serine protease